MDETMENSKGVFFFYYYYYYLNNTEIQSLKKDLHEYINN